MFAEAHDDNTDFMDGENANSNDGDEKSLAGQIASKSDDDVVDVAVDDVAVDDVAEDVVGDDVDDDVAEDVVGNYVDDGIVDVIPGDDVAGVACDDAAAVVVVVEGIAAGGVAWQRVAGTHSLRYNSHDDAAGKKRTLNTMMAMRTMKARGNFGNSVAVVKDFDDIEGGGFDDGLYRHTNDNGRHPADDDDAAVMMMMLQ